MGVSLASEKNFKNQKASVAVGYWVSISVHIMGPANIVVAGWYCSTKSLHKWKECVHGVQVKSCICAIQVFKCFKR